MQDREGLKHQGVTTPLVAKGCCSFVALDQHAYDLPRKVAVDVSREAGREDSEQEDAVKISER